MLGFLERDVVPEFRADGEISEFCSKFDINILDGSASVWANIPRAIVNEMFNRMPELGEEVEECVNNVRDGLLWKVCVKLISRCYR